jgi:hypothetical protein
MAKSSELSYPLVQAAPHNKASEDEAVEPSNKEVDKDKEEEHKNKEDDKGPGWRKSRLLGDLFSFLVRS